MPRGLTDRVIIRQGRVYKFVESEICVTTRQVIQMFGLTHSEAFYILQMLKNKGLIEEHVIGKISMWCITGHMMNDVYVDGVLISVSDLERAICKMIENVKGRKMTIRVSWVVDRIAEKVRVNPRQPRFLSYISEMLPIMLSNVEKMVFADSRGIEFYVVDTCSMCNHFSECPACEILRKKLNC